MKDDCRFFFLLVKIVRDVPMNAQVPDLHIRVVEEEQYHFVEPISSVHLK